MRSLLVFIIAVLTVAFEAAAVAAPQQQFAIPATPQAQRRAVARPPTLSRVSTSPPRPTTDQPITLALAGSNISPADVELVITGPGCTPCVVPNEVLSSSTESRVVAPASLVNPGTYAIALRNGSSTVSNSFSITVGGPASAAGLSVHSIDTAPRNPAVAQPFEFTLTGGGLNRRGMQVVITGPGCVPCVVPPEALSVSSAGRAHGRATLNQPGLYTLAVREGPNGAPSRGISLSVVAPPPSIASVTLSPPRPTVSDPFTFRVNGANIDESVQVIITGPGCSPCVVPGSDLDAVTPTRVVGQARLENPGTYQIALRHGAASPPSSGLQITVGGGGPSLSRLHTVPGNPRAAETFTFRLTGNGMNSNTVEVVVSGPGCSPCVVPNDALTIERNGRVSGAATLNLPGRYEFTVRNGNTGAPSASLELGIR